MAISPGHFLLGDTKSAARVTLHYNKFRHRDKNQTHAPATYLWRVTSPRLSLSLCAYCANLCNHAERARAESFDLSMKIWIP